MKLPIFSTASVISLILFSQTVLAQSRPPSPSQPSAEPTQVSPSINPNPSEVESRSNPISQRSSEENFPSCPAGQFASKFSDVTPQDWAYEAVNRIARGSFRCFPFPSRS